MYEFWKLALKASAPIAIVGYLIWIILTSFYEEQIKNNIGTEQQFTIVLIIVLGLLICLLAAILVNRQNPVAKTKVPKSKVKTIFKKSKIKGDVVIGDKHVIKKNR